MVSLIITVKNERQTLPAWLESIKVQSRQPDEIIVVDGGSNDGTWEWLQTIAGTHVKVFQKIGNIATGRNYAITLAKGDLVAVTDAGCTYSKDWLEKLVSLLEKGELFVASAFKPGINAEDGLLLHLIAAATTPSDKEFSKPWLPSSRSVAFTKAVWGKVGGYPEWIPFCEDVIFDLRLKNFGVTPFLVKETLVVWRPRTSIGKYFRQLFNYTKSDGHGKLWYGRQLTRFAVYASLVVLVYLATIQSCYWLLPVLIGGCAYMKKFWSRFAHFAAHLPIIKKITGFTALPVILFIGDIAKMFGWLTGVFERRTGRIKFQQWK